MIRAVRAAGLAILTAACSSSSAPGLDAGDDAAETSTEDVGAPDAAADVDKSATCVGAFGDQIGSVGFARFDGTVLAVLPPNDQACAAPNSTHAILEIQASGAAYRMVIDVDDKFSPGTIHTDTIAHALVGPPWADGWQTLQLDYVGSLGVHASDFTTRSTSDAVAWLTSPIAVGAHVSVYATAQGEVDSAHLIHRNVPSADGAIVVDPESATPTWLLFAFGDQSF